MPTDLLVRNRTPRFARLSRETLIEAFEVYGEILNVRLVKNGNQAIVSFVHGENADEAIRSLHGRPLYGAYLIVTRVGVHRRRRYQQRVAVAAREVIAVEANETLQPRAHLAEGVPHEVIAVEADIAVVADETLQPSAQAEGVPNEVIAVVADETLQPSAQAEGVPHEVIAAVADETLQPSALAEGVPHEVIAAVADDTLELSSHEEEGPGGGDGWPDLQPSSPFLEEEVTGGRDESPPLPSSSPEELDGTSR